MSIFQKIAELEQTGCPFAVVTIIHATESSPGRTAFKMAVTADNAWGSLGGGKLEFDAQKMAREAIARRIAVQTVSVDLTDEAQGGNGMACGGHADLLIETFQPAPLLYIFGGGHIGHALTEIMAKTGFSVTVIDNRADYANFTRHPLANETMQVSAYTDVKCLDFPKDAWFVIVTHGHEGDLDCLTGLLEQPELNAKYIGLIGSAKKLSRVFTELVQNGTPREALEKVNAPIGLDLGGQSADEIAVAIAAEIQAIRYGRDISNAMKYKKPVVF